MDRQAAVCRLDARERIAAPLLDVHDPLSEQDLIHSPSFNLSMTQEEIGDHLSLTVVHVNRTLRKLREERLALVDRQAVMIMDLDGLRSLIEGLSTIGGMTTVAMPETDMSVATFVLSISDIIINLIF